MHVWKVSAGSYSTTLVMTDRRELSEVAPNLGRWTGRDEITAIEYVGETFNDASFAKSPVVTESVDNPGQFFIVLPDLTLVRFANHDIRYFESALAPHEWLAEYFRSPARMKPAEVSA